MKVAVFGASGVQGVAQVAALARAGHDPVAISRSSKPISIDGKPVATCAADFDDPASIARAVESAEVVFLNLPSTSFQPTPPILQAAQTVADKIRQSSSVKMVVFNTSMPVPPEKRGLHAEDDRVDMRRILRDTLANPSAPDSEKEGAAIPVISIQPVVFLENLLEGWAYPGIKQRDTVEYCHRPDLEASWICHHDVAQLMMAAMTRPHLDGRDFDVGGPETVRLVQLTEKLGRAWGRPNLTCRNQSVDEFCDIMGEAMRKRSGIDADKIAAQMRKTYTFYNDSPQKPFRIDMAPVLEELPVKLTTIEEWGRSVKHRIDE